MLASTAFGFLTVIANYLVPERVFSFLLATSGAIALLVYLVIAVSQLRMRARLDIAKDGPQLKMWCFPWLTRAVIAFICAVLAVMLLDKNHRMEVGATAALAICVVAASWLNRGYRQRQQQANAAKIPLRVQ